MEYSELVRARMVRCMVGPSAVTASDLQRKSGIPQPTVSRWLRGAASLRLVTKRARDWSAKERMQFVLDTDGLGDQELSELLRRRGVHREQLDTWRSALDEAFARPTASRRPPEGRRIKALEREVARTRIFTRARS